MKEKLKQLREKAAKAAADARKIKQEVDVAGGTWTPEKEQEFSALVKESAATMAEAQKAQDHIDLEEKLAALDSHLNAPAAGVLPVRGREVQSATDADKRKEAHKRAQRVWLAAAATHGSHAENAAAEILREAGYDAKETHALIAGNDASLGFMVTDDFRAEVIRRMAMEAVMFNMAQVVPCSSNPLVFPRIAARTGTHANRYSSGFQGTWRTETAGTETGSVITAQDQPTGEQVRIPIHNWTPAPVICSPDLLQDSVVPIEPILAELITETQDLDMDYECIVGDGVNGPLGLLDAGSSLTTSNSGSNSGITYGGLVDLYTALPAQYRQSASFLTSSSMLGLMMKLEDTEGTHIFPPNTAPDKFFTWPMRFSEFVPGATAQNNLAGVFGNFKKYVIATRQDLRVQRLVERYAPNVGLLATARLGGGVVLPEAFRVMKISA